MQTAQWLITLTAMLLPAISGAPAARGNAWLASDRTADQFSE
jgi:hypothetical protein